MRYLFNQASLNLHSRALSPLHTLNLCLAWFLAKCKSSAEREQKKIQKLFKNGIIADSICYSLIATNRKCLMKNLAATAIAMASLGQGAHAQGIPVIDVASLTQAINQVLAWQAQYEQMARQIEQMQLQSSLSQQQLGSTTGNRGLGLINNSITKSAVDPNYLANLGTLNDYASANALSRTQLANLSQSSATRFAQIQSLMAAINTTNDPKAIAELNGRIQAEQAMIAVEQNEVALVRQGLETQIRAIDADRLQRSINAASQPVKSKAN